MCLQRKSPRQMLSPHVHVGGHSSIFSAISTSYLSASVPKMVKIREWSVKLSSSVWQVVRGCVGCLLSGRTHGPWSLVAQWWRGGDGRRRGEGLESHGNTKHIFQENSSIYATNGTNFMKEHDFLIKRVLLYLWYYYAFVIRKFCLETSTKVQQSNIKAI